MQPFRWKEEIAKRWSPLKETFRQHYTRRNSSRPWYGWKYVKEWLQ